MFNFDVQQTLFFACLILQLLFVGSCKKEAKPAPAPPPMCARFARGGEIPIAEVLCAKKDSDDDGVDDAVDLCLDLPEMFNGQEDGDGCPDPDRDRDGKMDYEDGCPDEAGQDPNGCPYADKDHDQIPDHLDGCPNRAEDLDGEEDGDGCPEGEFAVQGMPAGPQLWQSAQLTYRRKQARLNEAGARKLVELIDSLEWVKKDIVQVKIHAAASTKEGSGRYSQQKLAERRAASIQKEMGMLDLTDSLFEVETEIYERGDPRVVGEVSVEIYTKLDVDDLARRKLIMQQERERAAKGLPAADVQKKADEPF